MAELGDKSRPLIGELFDSWGDECVVEECDETRTVTFAAATEDEGGEEGYVTVPLCEAHLVGLFHDVVFARRLTRVAPIE